MFVSTVRKMKQRKMITYDKKNTCSNINGRNIDKNSSYFLCKKRQIIKKNFILNNKILLLDI